MSTLHENIINLCNKNGIKPGKLCDDLSLSRSLMSDLKMGRKTGINTETAMKIANYFEVPVERLYNSEIEKPATVVSSELSELDIKLIQILPKMTEAEKKLFLAQIDGILRAREQ